MKKGSVILLALLVAFRLVFAADYKVTNVNDEGNGSLRQAILDANATGGVDNILFAIPGGGPFILMPSSSLPVITGTTHINGFSQSESIRPGASWPARIMVVIKGNGLDGNGLEFSSTATGSSVRGLSIVGFGNSIDHAGLFINASNVTITGNFIGLTPDGIASANSVGIYIIGGDNSMIGGDLPEFRNVISGNTYEGITIMPAGELQDNFSTGHTIQYNFVGTNLDGTSAIGNGMHGIDMDGANYSFIYDNVIGGNGEYGIGCDANYSVNPPMIQNINIMRNRIGIGVNGEDIGNGVAGIMVINAHDITIGSSVTNSNTIAYNGTGVIVKDYPVGTGNHSYNVQITYNRIYNNDGLGIDLNDDGVTLNDYGGVSGPHDLDLGPNGLQNYPVIDSAYVADGNLHIEGWLRTDLSNSNYNIVFFNNPKNIVLADAFGYECYIRIGLIMVTTDATGFARFNVTYPYTTTFGQGQANYGDQIVSFARSVSENTSEFSPAVQVTAKADSVCLATSSEASYTVPADPLVISYNWTVPAGASILLGQGTSTVRVDWSGLGVGIYELCVSAVNSCGISTPTCIPVVIYNCSTNLVMTKTSNTNQAIAGQPLNYTLKVTNDGSIDAVNVLVNDVLSEGLTNVAGSTITGTWNAPIWNIGTLAPATSAILSLSSMIGHGFTGDSIVNTATVSSDTPESSSANNTATVINTVNKQADLSISKSTSADPVVAGRNIVYTITVLNQGSSDAHDVKVTDNLPVGLRLIDASPSIGSWSSSNWDIGTLAANTTATLTLNAQLNSNYSTGTLSNTAEVSSSTFDPNSINNTITTTTTVNTSADLSISKICNTSPVVAGSDVQYTLMVTNHGPSDATNVIYTDAMDTPVPFDAGSVFYSIDDGANWIPWTGSYSTNKPLVYDGTIHILLKGKLTSDYSSIVTNTATVNGSPGDPVLGNNSYTIHTPVGVSADISINKSGPASMDAGSNVTYTLLVSNAGPSNATEVVINDEFNGGIFTDANYWNGSDWLNWSGSLNLGTIISGTAATITIRAIVNSDLENGRVISNTAFANSSTPDGIAANNSSISTSTVSTSADIVVVKTKDVGTVVAGQEVNYTFSLSNLGPSVAKSVMAIEQFPTDLENLQYSINGSGVYIDLPATGEIPIGNLSPEAPVNVATIKIKGTVKPTSCGLLSNTVTYSSSTNDPVFSNNIATTPAVQIIDQTAPLILSCIEPVQIACPSELPAINASSLVANDNCTTSGNLIKAWEFDQLSDQFCENRYTLTRTFSVKDESNNISFCTQQITVNDQIPPLISCPDSIAVQCFDEVPAPDVNLISVSDNCSGEIAVTHVSDAISNQQCANKYTITRTYLATDGCGNNSSCQQIITVSDTTKPTFTPPANLTLNCDQDYSDLSITLEPSNLFDNCTAVHLLVPTYVDDYTNLSGCNGTGTIIRTWSLTDFCGNSKSLNQTIDIEDNNPPLVACIENQNRNTDIGRCSYAAIGSEFDPVTAFDDCGILSITYNLTGSTSGTGSGSLDGVLFNAGSTNVNWTVNDACGQYANCSFIISVNDNEPAEIVCPEDITINTDLNLCGAAVNYSSLIGSDNCSGITITQTAGFPSGSVFPVGETINTFMITEVSGNISTCSFKITVTDQEFPKIVCPDDIIVNNDLDECSAIVSYATPEGTDNCFSTTVQTTGLSSGSEFPVGITMNTFKVTDAAGNITFCSFTVTVRDTQNPTITCSNDLLLSAEPNQCGAIVSFDTPLATDNCPGTVIEQTAGIASGAYFPVGLTNNIFEVSDASGNKATCSFTVTVTDNENPTIICQDNIVVNTDRDECTTLIGIDSVVFEDLCSASSLAWSMTGATTGSGNGQIGNYTFNAGLTIVSYIVSDESIPVNTASCSFTVTVNDNQGPIIFCPPDMNVGTNAACSFIGSIGSATASDNCSFSEEIVIINDAPASFPVGTTTVNWTATDASNNSESCIQLITVSDDDAPGIECPANVVVATNLDCTSVGIVLGTPIITDDCSVLYATNDHSSSSYPLGNTTVNWTVSDENGNSTSCSQIVTVINSPPTVIGDNYSMLQNTISAPTSLGGNVLLNDIDPESQSLTVSSWGTPTSGAITTNSNGAFNYVPIVNFIGDVIFTYTIKDACGQEDTGIVTITVESCIESPTAPGIIMIAR